MKKKIDLKIISTRYEADTASMNSTPTSDAEPEELKIYTSAVMTTTKGKVEIVYNEGELTGLEGSRTHLIFNPAEPDVFTMQRSGLATATMVFVPGMRHVCKYRTPVMPFELMLTTHSLDNRLLDEGWLEVDYTTEIGRTSHARTLLRIEISDAAEDEEADIPGSAVAGKADEPKEDAEQ